MDVCWLHNQQEIPRSSNIFEFASEGHVHKLILPEVYPEDSGMYVCEVYNDFGDEDTSCILNVKSTCVTVHLCVSDCLSVCLSNVHIPFCYLETNHPNMPE